MTCGEKVDMLKAMLGPEDDTDRGVLTVYLKLAEQKILNRMYPYKENYDDLTVPDKYLMAQLNISCYLLNKRGAEGQIQHIENGIHRNYGDADVPDKMLADVVPFCHVIR